MLPPDAAQMSVAVWGTDGHPKSVTVSLSPSHGHANTHSCPSALGQLGMNLIHKCTATWQGLHGQNWRNRMGGGGLTRRPLAAHNSTVGR